MNWADLFSSSGYDYPLDVEPGSSFVGGTGYPDALVKETAILPVQGIVVQRMLLEASDESGKKELIRVTRIVLELFLGEIIELKRYAEKVEGDYAVDTSRCEACEGKIIDGTGTVVDGKAYHKRCVTEEGDERRDGRVRGVVGAVRGGAADGDHRRREGGSEACGPRVPQTIATKTAVKFFAEDGKRISHSVTIIRNGDEDVVVLVLDGRTGSAVGRWLTGFVPCSLDLPRDTDVEYVDDKFFGGARLLRRHALRLLNQLYLDALDELGL